MRTQGVAPVFHVADLEAALKYYTEALGFAEDFRFGAYAGVRLGEAAVHLGSGPGVHQRPIGAGTAYIFCDEIDSYFAEIRQKGATIKVEPRDWPYGMRDGTVVDPDGNLLHFGCEVKKGVG